MLQKGPVLLTLWFSTDCLNHKKIKIEVQQKAAILFQLCWGLMKYPQLSTFKVLHLICLKTCILKEISLGVHQKDWCWSWNSNTLATSCEELTHWKRPWCWEELGAGGEGDDRGWDGWMASPTRWTWVWVNSRSWWWTGRPGMLRFMGSQSRTQLSNWTELNWKYVCLVKLSP